MIRNLIEEFIQDCCIELIGNEELSDKFTIVEWEDKEYLVTIVPEDNDDYSILTNLLEKNNKI